MSNRWQNESSPFWKAETAQRCLCDRTGGSRRGQQVVPAGGVEDALGHPLQPGPVGDGGEGGLSVRRRGPELLAALDQQDVSLGLQGALGLPLSLPPGPTLV